MIARRPPRISAASLLALVVGAALAACGDPAPITAQPDAGTPGRQDARVLSRVGTPSIEAAPGEVITLRALLSQSEVGPVAGAQVNWRILKDPTGGSSLSADSSETDARGVGETQITVGNVPDDPDRLVEIKADSTGANNDRATWKIKVSVPTRHLEVVPSSGVRVVTNSTASITASVNRSIVLKVKVLTDKDPPMPVPGETVIFRFQNTPDSGSGIGLQGTGPGGAVMSDGAGEASAVLDVGTVAGRYTVLADIEAGAGASFDVTATSGPVGGCTSTSQCQQGEVCRNGACVTSGYTGGGGCAGDDMPCPLGFVCNTQTSACEPYTGGGNCEPACGQGTHCDTVTKTCIPDECQTPAECPGNAPCTNGVCVPTGDNALDVTGLWFTRHDFAIREALPSWLQSVAKAVRTVDQAFLGQLDLPSWVNQLIAGILHQYVPEWVPKLIYLLDSAMTIFSELRAEGEMELVATGGPRVLSGTETWTSFIFYFLPQCGGNIGGGSGNQQPACARVDIYTADLPADAAVEVKPFAARLLGSPPQTSTVVMDRRQVKMKLAGLIKYALDMLGSVITGYDTIEQALPELIDCAGLASAVGWPEAEPLCQVAVVAGVQIAVDQLKKVDRVGTDVLDFNGQATARPSTYSPTMAGELGFADFQTRNPADGKWTGKFKVGVSLHDVPGRWRGSRDPITQ